VIRALRARASQTTDWLAWLCYAGLLIFIVLPLWVMAALLAVRLGMYSLAGVPSTAQTSAFLTFIGGGLATSATVLGVLFTWQHNRQERHRLGLQAVIDSLESLNANTPPRVAGALASMVLLGHPRVAIRMLAPAWQAHQVDASTATWVIGQVLAPDRRETHGTDGDGADPPAVQEAAVLLSEHAGTLTKSQPGSYDFPGHFLDTWRTHPELPADARRHLLIAMGTMLASKNRDWWCPGGLPPAWPTLVLVECAQEDSDEELRSAAALLVGEIYRYFPWRFRKSARFRGNLDKLDSVLLAGAAARMEERFQDFSRLGDQMTQMWGEPPQSG